MAHLLTNLPTDITNLIDEKVQELYETDYRKATLKKLADEATTYMTCIIDEAMEWHSDNLHFAWLERLAILDEQDYGPSGDYGNYLSHSLDEYEAAIEGWNRFIDDFKHLSHLLGDFHAVRFKYRPL